jgi:hypothetical protein
MRAVTDPREKARTLWRAGVIYAQGEGRGLSLSLLVHGTALALIAWFFLHKPASSPQPDLHILPVEVVRVGEETVSPPTPVKAKIPAPFTPPRPNHTPASANRPEGTSPHGTKPVDDLETRLRALAHLRNPETNTVPLTAPSASDAAASDAPEGSTAMYAVRDLIRAQIERRWTFDVSKLKGHDLRVVLHIVLQKNGVVNKAEILDRERYATDAIFRDIAISARNAVLLSSPLTMPPGDYPDVLDVTLRLNPRDTQR